MFMNVVYRGLPELITSLLESVPDRAETTIEVTMKWHKSKVRRTHEPLPPASGRI